MKNLLTLLFACCISYGGFAQSSLQQGGYLMITDKTAEGYVYYLSEYLTCEFMPDVDKQLYAKKDIMKSYKEYVEATYKLVDPTDADQSEWLIPGRGVNPENVYHKKIINLEKVGPSGKVIIVKEYVFNCPKE